MCNLAKWPIVAVPACEGLLFTLQLKLTVEKVPVVPEFPQNMDKNSAVRAEQ